MVSTKEEKSMTETSKKIRRSNNRVRNFRFSRYLLLFAAIFPRDSLADGVTISEAKQLSNIERRYLDIERDMLTSLQYGARCPCGYCHIADVESHKQDEMASFFLSETFEYLWLLFDLAVGPENLVENGPYEYIFSTEGRLLHVTPEISLVSEHYSSLGAFYKDDRWKEHGPTDQLIGLLRNK